jgi:hypothetical protein
MFCQKCGKENHESAKFCVGCGTSFIPGQPVVVPKVETTLTQVFEGALVFGIVGGLIGLMGGIAGAMGGFMVMFILGIIVCYAGASVYDLFRKQEVPK